MVIIVRPVQCCQKVGDKTFLRLYYLKWKTNNSRLYNTKCVAQEIGELDNVSAEDMEHATTALVHNTKRKLTDGDSVKLDGLGVFYITFRSKGTTSSEECAVKNTDKVNIRFLTDSGLRLVNGFGTTTKGSPNNVTFNLCNPKEGGPLGGDGSDSGDGGEEQDPLG